MKDVEGARAGAGGFSVFSDKGESSAGHDESHDKDDDHVPKGNPVDSSIQLALLEAILALIHHNFGVFTCIDNHGINILRVDHDGSSVKKLLKIQILLLPILSRI